MIAVNKRDSITQPKRKMKNKTAAYLNNDNGLVRPPRRRLSIGSKKDKKTRNYFDVSMSISEASEIFSSDYSEMNGGGATSNDEYYFPEPPLPPPEALKAAGAGPGGKGKGDEQGRRLIDLIQKLSIRAAMVMTRSSAGKPPRPTRRSRNGKSSSSSTPASQQQQKLQEHLPPHLQKQLEQQQQLQKQPTQGDAKPRSSTSTHTTKSTVGSLVGSSSHHKRETTRA